MSTKFAEHKTWRLPKLGFVQVGRKSVVGGIDEFVREAPEPGIRSGRIQDNFGALLTAATWPPAPSLKPAAKP